MAIGVYTSVLKRIREGGGKVRVAEFELADALVCFVLTSLFAMLVGAAWVQPRPAQGAIDVNNVLVGSPFPILMVGIASFLAYRGIKLTRLLGFDRISVGRSLLMAVGLIMAAYPLVFLASSISEALWHESENEQGLVTLFREMSRQNNFKSMSIIFLAAVVLAPISEEFVFRGYFYGTLKRYCGPVGSALLTAALFAAIHLNLQSLLSLFALALTLTVAYEATGSLLVPVTMHALFNFSQLAYLYWSAQSQPS